MDSTLHRAVRGVLAAPALAMLLATPAGAAPDSKRWTDDELVASYRDLTASGGLDAAIRSPKLPADPPQTNFLDALAWFAAGSPARAGTLTSAQLDEFLRGQAQAYKQLLGAKVERGEANDYARTRTWKVIQKLTLVADAMLRPAAQRKLRVPGPVARAERGRSVGPRAHLALCGGVRRESLPWLGHASGAGEVRQHELHPVHAVRDDRLGEGDRRVARRRGRVQALVGPQARRLLRRARSAIRNVWTSWPRPKV